MSDDEGHDPNPDGRTGPFRREHHLMVPDTFTFAFDERCAFCREWEKARRDALDAMVEQEQERGVVRSADLF